MVGTVQNRNAEEQQHLVNMNSIKRLAELPSRGRKEGRLHRPSHTMVIQSNKRYTQKCNGLHLKCFQGLSSFSSLAVKGGYYNRISVQTASKSQICKRPRGHTFGGGGGIPRALQYMATYSCSLGMPAAHLTLRVYGLITSSLENILYTPRLTSVADM